MAIVDSHVRYGITAYGWTSNKHEYLQKISAFHSTLNFKNTYYIKLIFPDNTIGIYLLCFHVLFRKRWTFHMIIPICMRMY